MIEKLDNAIFSDYHMVFGDLDSVVATFFISDSDLNSMSFFNVRLIGWYNKFKQRKALKKRYMKN